MKNPVQNCFDSLILDDEAIKKFLSEKMRPILYLDFLWKVTVYLQITGKSSSELSVEAGYKPATLAQYMMDFLSLDTIKKKKLQKILDIINPVIDQNEVPEFLKDLKPVFPV